MKREEREGARIFILLIVAVMALTPLRAGAHEGWGIVVDRQGRVVFGDIPANLIWRVSAGSGVERVLTGKHSHALLLDSSGSLTGTNPHLTQPIGSVWRLSPDGQLVDLIPPTKDFQLGLQSFIIDGAGNMYSVNARNAQTPALVLLKRTPDGQITTFAGSTPGHADGTGSQAKFLGIDGMAWAPDGALYLADGPYVRRVDKNGVVTTVGGGPLTEKKWDVGLLGVAIDAKGNVLAADHPNRRILRITPEGEVSTVLNTGWLWAPTGIAETDGNLYVLEHLRMPLAILGDLGVGPYLRVRRMSANNEVVELARIWGRRSGSFAAVLASIAGLIVLAAYIHRRRVA